MPTKRELLTGQRFGKLLIIMEIEKTNRTGHYEVVVFCYGCKKAKRLHKAAFQGYSRLPQSCSCANKRSFARGVNGQGSQPLTRPQPLGKGDKGDYERASYGSVRLKGIK